MYKLMGVSGFYRGKNFILKDGEQSFGRDSNCDIILDNSGISKNHFSITVINDQVQLTNKSQSNGTFVNGNLAQKIFLSKGDLISIPGNIFKLVKFKQANNSTLNEENLDRKNNSKLDENINSKSIFYKLNSILSEINTTYEWSTLLGGMLVVLVILSMYISIAPIIEDTKSLVLHELELRGKQYVDEIERANAVMLGRMQIENINDYALRNAGSDINSYLIFDANGRVIRPVDKLNSYINDSFAVELSSWAKANEDNSDTVYIKNVEDGMIGVGKAIKVLNVETGKNSIVGYVSIHFSPDTLSLMVINNRIAYVKSLVVSLILCFIFYFLILQMTKNNIGHIDEQIDAALLGKVKHVQSKYLMSIQDSLIKSINGLISRVKESSGETNWENESDEIYLQKYYEIMRGVRVGAIVLDQHKNIKFINPIAEELLGIREKSSQGSSILDCFRDQGLAATVLDCCENSQLSAGTVSMSSVDIKGSSMEVSVIAAMGKDQYPKSFIVFFNGVS
jgi:PAS domain-containing protein